MNSPRAGHHEHQFAIWSKRLEAGTYAVPLAESADERRREITAQELGALLSGIDLSTAKRENGTGARMHKTFLSTVVFTWKWTDFRVS